MTTTAQINEKLIEAVAVALARSQDKDPDEIIGYEGEGWLLNGPRWKSYRVEAIKQIAAFDAIREFWRMTGKAF